MRVTRLIKDYITSEIHKKFQPAYDAIGTDLDKRIKQCGEELKQLKEETEKKAIEIGKKYHLDYGGSLGIVRINNYFSNDAEYRDASAKRAELNKKEQAAINDILVSLELGATKAELQGLLDAVQV